MKRIAASMPDALIEGVTAYQKEKGLPSWSAALNDIVSSALKIDVALPVHGGAREGAGQKPGGKMDHKAIVEAYLKFWHVDPKASERVLAFPVVVALKVLNEADRRLFDSREALQEAVAGSVMDLCNARGKVAEVMAFAEAFVGGLPQSWINDPSEAIGRHADQLVAMYASMAKK